MARQAGHTEAGAGPQDGDGSPVPTLHVGTYDREILVDQHLRGKGERFEIIDQDGLIEAEFLEVALRDLPSSIREARGAGVHRTRHRDGRDGRLGLGRGAREVAMQRVDEGGKRLGQILPVLNPPGGRPGGVDDGKARMRAAHVADQDWLAAAQETRPSPSNRRSTSSSAASQSSTSWAGCETPRFRSEIGGQRDRRMTVLAVAGRDGDADILDPAVVAGFGCAARGTGPPGGLRRNGSTRERSSRRGRDRTAGRPPPGRPSWEGRDRRCRRPLPFSQSLRSWSYAAVSCRSWS